MTYTVTGGVSKVNFGASGAEEVMQNVRMILTTPIYTVPLDRTFGIDWSMLDNPIPMAQTKLTAQIFESIRKYEPRAMVIEIDFLQDTSEAMDGKMIPRVRLEVNMDGSA